MQIQNGKGYLPSNSKLEHFQQTFGGEERLFLDHISAAMELSDQTRAWYDARDCGLLSKSHPFQSAVCTSSVMASKKSTDFLEDKLVEFCASIPTNKIKRLSIDSGLLNRHLQSISCGDSNGMFRASGTDKGKNSTQSISDGIALADDLYASNENLSKTMLKAHGEEMEHARTLLNEALSSAAAAARKAEEAVQASRQISNRNDRDSAPSTQSSAANNAVANKFRSAKDQFAAEVRYCTFTRPECFSTNNPLMIHFSSLLTIQFCTQFPLFTILPPHREAS